MPSAHSSHSSVSVCFVKQTVSLQRTFVCVSGRGTDWPECERCVSKNGAEMGIGRNRWGRDMRDDGSARTGMERRRKRERDVGEKGERNRGMKRIHFDATFDATSEQDRRSTESDSQSVDDSRVILLVHRFWIPAHSHCHLSPPHFS